MTHHNSFWIIMTWDIKKIPNIRQMYTVLAIFWAGVCNVAMPKYVIWEIYELKRYGAHERWLLCPQKIFSARNHVACRYVSNGTVLWLQSMPFSMGVREVIELKFIRFKHPCCCMRIIEERNLRKRLGLPRKSGKKGWLAGWTSSSLSDLLSIQLQTRKASRKEGRGKEGRKGQN